jgi:hypothetical protein
MTKENEMPTAQAPKTVGPRFYEMTVREQAAEAWARQSSDERHKAERAARNLAKSVFGNTVEIVFDEFVPESFAKRHHYEPCHLVTFEVEGLEFNYREQTKQGPECFLLIDMCACERGPRILATIHTLASIGRAYEWDYSDVKCMSCKDDDEKAAAKT